MKNMNKYEREVNSLSFEEMDKLSKKDMQWINTTADKYLKKARQEQYEEIGRRYGTLATYHVIYQRVKNWQVIRFIMTREKDCPKNRIVFEPLRYWINNEGNSVIECKLRQCYGNNLIDPWCVSTKLEIHRPLANGRDVRKLEWTEHFLKIKSLIPELKRMEFKEPWGLPYFYTKSILRDGHLEMLHRMNLIDLAHKYYLLENNQEEYWTAIRIALRHHYPLDNSVILNTWWDMVTMEIQCGADIHNPHFVAPDDLHAMHNQFVGRNNNRIQREQDSMREKREIESYNKTEIKYEDTYKADKKRWLKIAFSDDKFQCHVLQSVKEFLDEGIAMHHCVFACGYYKRQNSIIVSITDHMGKRIETAEINTKRFYIMQQLGNYDVCSEWHKEIKQFLRNNMWRFKQASMKAGRKAV